MGKEMRASADREEGPLADRILFLQFGEGPNKTERLGLLLDDFRGVPTEDDKDVVVFQLVVGLLIGNLGDKRDVLRGEDSLIRPGNGAVKSLGLCVGLSRSEARSHVASDGRGRIEDAVTTYLGRWGHGERW